MESKIRFLTGHLEHNEHIELAHVNPKRFECQEQQTKAAEFSSMWVVGIQFKQMEKLNVNLTENIQNFTNLVHKHGSGLMKPGMNIEVRHVRRKELSTYLGKNVTKAAATTPMIMPATSTTGNMKRMSTETVSQLERSESSQMIKRQRSN